jgi:hypothetical protein
MRAAAIVIFIAYSTAPDTVAKAIPQQRASLLYLHCDCNVLWWSPTAVRSATFRAIVRGTDPAKQ